MFFAICAAAWSALACVQVVAAAAAWADGDAPRTRLSLTAAAVSFALSVANIAAAGVLA